VLPTPEATALPPSRRLVTLLVPSHTTPRPVGSGEHVRKEGAQGIAVDRPAATSPSRYRSTGVLGTRRNDSR
jgi:hypothetical protein